MKRLVLLLLVAACGVKPVRGVQLIDAPAGTTDVAALVAKTETTVQAQKRRLLVYVGAGWCEPCRAIHEAAAAHQLDATFPDLTLLVFDLDRDGDALKKAGYDSEYIPLFTVPAPDGRATARHAEGGVKGPAAVEVITAKLKDLLAT